MIGEYCSRVTAYEGLCVRDVLMYADSLLPTDKGHERIASELYKFVCALNGAKDE